MPARACGHPDLTFRGFSRALFVEKSVMHSPIPTQGVAPEQFPTPPYTTRFLPPSLHWLVGPSVDNVHGHGKEHG